jgi:phenylpropionate dioxygenase-like ring-hydroxylating dioxygenase large terminal subunit
MKIEITKSTPEQEKFQALFNQTDEETIALLVKENEELYAKLEAWKTCADNLIDYAHEYVAHLSTWGKGYNRYDKDIKQAEDAIEEYLKLKNEK